MPETTSCWGHDRMTAGKYVVTRFFDFGIISVCRSDLISYLNIRKIFIFKAYFCIYYYHRSTEYGKRQMRYKYFEILRRDLTVLAREYEYR